MKKKILLSLLILIPFNAKAASMSVSCNKTTAEPSSTINCTINAFDSEVSGGEGDVLVTNGTIKNVTKNKCGYGNVANNRFECVDDVVNNSMSLVTYTIEVGQEGTTTITIGNAKVVGNNFETLGMGTISTNINIVKPVVAPKEEVKAQPKLEEKPKTVAVQPEENTPTEEVEQTIEEPIEEEKHGLKSFKIFDKEYVINDDSIDTFTMDVTTNDTNITFNYETYSNSDDVSINTRQIKDGFNKLIIKYSYNDDEREYVVYLYKNPIIEKENNTYKYILGFICGFLVGIVTVLLIKIFIKKNKNTYNEPLLSNNKEPSLSEFIK